ncbi:Qat anti-phage system associated protein QatB [Parabacteroides distasonis]|uniref:Qat anti-phage system associated protein QatB n=1 Tax=Parabacteroides distasonis TaxID=823 RepID=UPI0039B469D6
MGTSSMYGGPNRSPLLPPDFNDGDDNSDNPTSPDTPLPKPDEKPNEEKEPAQTPESDKPSNKEQDDEPRYSSWRAAKNSMSKYASGNGGENGKRNAVSNYVKGYGGSRNAAKSAKSAIRTTINIGDFFNSVSKKGIVQVLQDYNIQTEGRKPKEILNDIVNQLAPAPDSNENAIARKALINTMSVIYDKFEDEKKDISLLDTTDSNISSMLINKYFETFIYERLINEMGSRIEKKAESSAAAERIEKDLKEYIESKVSTTLKDKPLSLINLQTKNVYTLVEGLYQQCYKVLEDQL